MIAAYVLAASAVFSPCLVPSAFKRAAFAAPSGELALIVAGVRVRETGCAGADVGDELLFGVPKDAGPLGPMLTLPLGAAAFSAS